MRDNPSLCDMKHWVHGEFQRDKFIPSGYTRTASLKPPRDLKFGKTTVSLVFEGGGTTLLEKQKSMGYWR